MRNRAMSEANINLVKSLYDAFGRRDQATILSLIDPAIDIQQSDQLPWEVRITDRRECWLSSKSF